MLSFSTFEPGRSVLRCPHRGRLASDAAFGARYTFVAEKGSIICALSRRLPVAHVTLPPYHSLPFCGRYAPFCCGESGDPAQARFSLPALITRALIRT